MCSSDLQSTTTEWLMEDRVVVQANQSPAVLEFMHVNSSIHNSAYTCRISNEYGSVEKALIISVQGQ